MASDLRYAGLLALLFVAAALVYLPTVDYPYVWEDRNDMGRWSRSLWDANTVNPARVLTEASIEVGRFLGGAQPDGQHLVNVAWHCLNGLLVFALAWLLLPPAGALLAAGVFLLHPLQLEAVAYISGRADLVVTTGILVALLGVVLESFTVALVGVLLACLSKEVGATAWLLVPLWALWRVPAFPTRRWLLVLASGGLLGGLWMWGQIRDAVLAVDPAHLGRVASGIWRLTALAVVPIGQSIDHDWFGVPLAVNAVALLALVGVTAWAATEGYARRSWAALAWLTMLVWCAPRFLVPEVEGLHEHHFVVPMIGWALVLGAWGSSIRFEMARS